MNRINELIIQLHRYIGIPMSVIIVVWFASGIVMMYTRGMPALSSEQALDLKSAIPFAEVTMTPGEAMQHNGMIRRPQTVTVDTLLLRPVYRIGGTTIFADNGEIFEGANSQAGHEIVATAFELPTSRVRFFGYIFGPDQWTITERRHLPALKYILDDEQATEAYVSIDSGEIFLATDKTSRFLAWIGAIPHWIYFTTLRTNQPAWFWVIVLLSSIGCLIAVLGLILTFTQFRKSTPFSLMESIRYRGLMRWHYLTGAIFGVLALTWLFSGLLSMDPFDWNEQRGLTVDAATLNSGHTLVATIHPGVVSAIPSSSTLKRLEIVNVLGEMRYIEHHSGQEGRRVVDPANPDELAQPPAVADYLSRIGRTMGAGVLNADLLTDYDDYYYDRDRLRPLPVVRVSFDDPMKSTSYIDQETGRVVMSTHSMARLDRWLFNGLHSLDFSFWYDKRPLWDIVVITLSIGGLATSGIGMWVGFRRMRRWLVRRQPDAR